MRHSRAANIQRHMNSHKPGPNSRMPFRSWAISRALLTIVLLTVVTQAQAADITLLHTFTGGNDGAFPYSGLTADAAGNMYGTTPAAGKFGAGTVFQISPVTGGGWKFSTIYEFTGGTDGASPLGSLVFDAAGNGYATAGGGGAQGRGVVFELTPPKNRQPGAKWAEKVLYNFQGVTDGAIPFGNVIFDAAGNLYGTTSIGGHSHVGCLQGCGTVYKLEPRANGEWHETVLHRFIDAFGQGAEPRTGLAFDADGNLYGTTFSGGNNSVNACNTVFTLGCGTVFELTSSAGHWHLVTLRDFNGTDGARPLGGVTLNGNILYGSTSFGGTNNAGTVFSFTKEAGVWKPGKVFSFDGTNGLGPFGTLALDQAGNLFGTTSQGGTNNWGAIFQLVAANGGWTEKVLFNFPVSGIHSGAGPTDGVLVDTAGDLYLTTAQGGNVNFCAANAGCGTVIKFSGGTR